MRNQKLFVSKVFNYKEILGFVVFIVLIAYILFPKHYILETLNKLNIGGNYIKRLYIENLIKHHEISDDILEKMLVYYIKTYRYQEAKGLLLAIKKGGYNLKALPLLEYYVLKEKYFSTKDPTKRALIKKTMAKYLMDYMRRNPTRKAIITVYRESLAMDLKQTEALALYKLAYYTNDINIIEKAVAMAMYLNDKNELTALTNKLLNMKNKSSKQKILIYDLCNYLHYTACLSTYFKELEKDKSFVRSHYSDVLMSCVKNHDIQCIENTINILPTSLKKEAIEKSITYSFWDKDYSLAKILILRYIHFSKEPDFVNFMIKNTLATGDLAFEKKIGSEVLKLYEK
ncbi:MAG: hypothetical protein C0170_06600 [Hydrogenobaculum sp.]|nr:MAG: hypothetical protein C0194_00185 [Hydrogenobaculum sp.]PMP90406.1 MAG: hypothetical protein C0170_06600 [Hydrogenobaculum sp.]HEK25865.1 hypothetical protein [Hydrogenobaculum sp.]